VTNWGGEEAGVCFYLVRKPTHCTPDVQVSDHSALAPHSNGGSAQATTRRSAKRSNTNASRPS